MTKKLAAILILLAAAVAGTVGFALSGFYNVAADVPHGRVLGWLLSSASRASVERRAVSVDVPDLNNDRLRLAGASDFNAMCAGCHGAPGQEPRAIGRGLNPPPPDLAESAAQMTPSELFWITKHGIRMTGMPAWGKTHDDVALWPVVAFMTTLPVMTAQDYQSLLKKAEGVGHHASDDSAKTTSAKRTHDHSTHSHSTQKK